jgi:NAD(P)-dependent dehydrogenase (short-subunit alcohol dehydrogenase family)
MDYLDQHVIVTGGTGALGAAVVGALVDAGATCHVPYVVAAEAERFALLPHERVKLVAMSDLADEADVARLFGSVNQLWASIHLVGGFAMAEVAQTTKAELMKQIEMNLVTSFLCSRGAVNAMTCRGGRIVNVAARPALEPRSGAGMASYTASKAAVVAFTIALSEEVAKLGILVNAGRTIDQGHAREPRRHAESRSCGLAQGRGSRGDDPVSPRHRTQ